MPAAALPRRSPAALLEAARAGIADAVAAPEPADRYARAHLAALRAASAVLAIRARPSGGRSGRASRSVWMLLGAVAPELAEWAAFFAAGAGKRAAAESGISRAASGREADDLLRDVQTFLGLATSLIAADTVAAVTADAAGAVADAVTDALALAVADAIADAVTAPGGLLTPPAG